MKTIYFVRHGQTLFNKLDKVQGASDSPLTSLGEKSADQLGRLFKEQEIGFEVAYTSDLGRARQTAKRIISHSQYPDTPLIENTDLREVSFGSFEGGSNDGLWAEVNKASGNRTITAADQIHIFDTIKAIDPLSLAENFEEIQQRIKRVLKLISSTEASQLLFISHGLFIDCLLYVISNKQHRATSIPNTSVTKIIFDQNAFCIEYIGEIEHF